VLTQAAASKSLAVLAAGVCLAALAASPALAAPAPPSRADGVQGAEIRQLQEDVAKNEKWFDRILLPITILLGILGLGGGLGVVFSIRDQRRISQLHQLTVTGELSSQRRAEQGYAAFLEQSQTTLSLVNDTLKLGKEATDSAAHSLKQKAQSQVNAIEERARELMIRAISEGEFERIVADSGHRGELHSIAESLRTLEGYLSLQDMELPENAQFVKAVDQFLHDETEAARRALELASQERAVGGLGQFVEYWLGYVLTTVGDYRDALAKFQFEVTERSSQYFQLKRVIAETEFFVRAEVSAREAQKEGQKGGEDPHQRFERVTDLLDGLAARAAQMEEPSGEQAKPEDRLKVARTRADILEWVAYDPAHLDVPIESRKRARAKAIKGIFEPVGSFATFAQSTLWNELQHPDHFRFWALSQAKAICEGQPEPDVDLRFALAECCFKLGLDKKQTGVALMAVVHELPRQLGPNLEKRRIASLHECLLIAHVRLHKLDAKEAAKHASDARRAHSNAREALYDIEPRVTVFSQIQRRNLTKGEFEEEINAIIDQEHIKPDG
jgi:hypothetical protein